MVSDTCLHRRSYPERLMDVAEIVVHEVQRHGVGIDRESPQIVAGLLKCFTEQMGYDGDELSSFLRSLK